MPVRPETFVSVLQNWKQSCLWHFRAKQFVENNEVHFMQIDDKKSLIEEFYWTVEKAISLGEEIDAKNSEIYADVNLVKQTKEKIRRLLHL